MNRMQGPNSWDTADRSSEAVVERLSILFILTHKPLGRVWERAAERPAADDIGLQIDAAQSTGSVDTRTRAAIKERAYRLIVK